MDSGYPGRVEETNREQMSYESAFPFGGDRHVELGRV